MIIAIDTNRYRDFCEGVPEAVERLRVAERICLPFPVLAGLRAGFACGTVARHNEAVLNRFLCRPRVALLRGRDLSRRRTALDVLESIERCCRCVAAELYSTVMATRKGAAPVTRETKSMWRTSSCGRGLT